MNGVHPSASRNACG